MINPPNNNKFIGLQDQQTLGQLNDPLQAEQDFLAKRMSQPVPVPGDQSPMMQTNYPHARVKQRAMQPLMPMERTENVREAVIQPIQKEIQKPYKTGYERIVRSKTPDQLKDIAQKPRFEQVPQQTAPFRQDDPNKGRPYVVNKEKTGTSKDTLFLPKDTYVSKSGLAEDSDIDDAARKAAADGIYNYTGGNKNFNFEYLENQGKVKYKK